MGFWAGIKYALNSTLGTSDFVPLDVQIAEQSTLYASDEVYATIGNGIEVSVNVNGTSGVSATKEYSHKIKMSSSGSCVFSVPNVKFYNTYIDQRVQFEVYKNGKQVFAEYFEKESGKTSFKTDTILFYKGDTISFSFYFYFPGAYSSTGSYIATATFDPVQILGTIKQSVMKILEV